MSKEEFLKKLKKNLKYLKKKDYLEEIKNYENLENYNLDPEVEANRIYERKGLTIRITNSIKFLDALNCLIKNIKNKEKRKDIIFFLIKLLSIIIFIEIPFIYVRDMVVTLFNETFLNDNNYTLWSLIIDIIYGITAMIIMIKLIKKQAYKLEQETSKK